MTIDRIYVLLVSYPTIHVTVSNFLSISVPLSKSVGLENVVLPFIWIEFYMHTFHQMECSKPYFVTVGLFFYFDLAFGLQLLLVLLQVNQGIFRQACKCSEWKQNNNNNLLSYFVTLGTVV